jgi:hypothetical protein
MQPELAFAAGRSPESPDETGMGVLAGSVAVHRRDASQRVDLETLALRDSRRRFWTTVATGTAVVS